MKTLLTLIALVAALTCAAQDLPAEIKLTNGFVMKGCTIVRWETDLITVKYAGGTVPVRFENIDPDDRALILAHQEAALREQAIADEKAAKAQAAAEHKQAEQEKRAELKQEKKQAEIDRKNAAIQLGLEQHHLVAGMTMDQVRSLFGPPWQFSSLTEVNASEWWIYPGLGRDGNGVPTNLQVHFKDGLVTRWNNTQR
jgi:hypothetical protein